MLLCITIPGILMMITFVFIPLLNGSRDTFFHGMGTVKYEICGAFENFCRPAQRFLSAKNHAQHPDIRYCAPRKMSSVYCLRCLSIKFRGRNAVRAIVYMPIDFGVYHGKDSVIHDNDNGVLNDIVNLFGHENIYWMKNSWAGVAIITLANTWQYVGLSVAGLSCRATIDPSKLRGSCKNRRRK